ncbi:hypothetical protein AB0N89_30525, partial [Amycolatopsis sp. NPDC089917]|uniref:hypothetical protein n=1 Tax=Amycolatopsis sp. NPDC089917 TaxID=3155187 RepID=UPI00342D1E9D
MIDPEGTHTAKPGKEEAGGGGFGGCGGVFLFFGGVVWGVCFGLGFVRFIWAGYLVFFIRLVPDFFFNAIGVP